ncbi:hypothetical protein WJX84_002681 [Apatococcus fuscideae]|uniref:Kinesin-like protein n=1 Tax=Apatococcus fuscideae TaxID=2026836 RepID=A0AAW1SVW7_9CHLO
MSGLPGRSSPVQVVVRVRPLLVHEQKQQASLALGDDGLIRVAHGDVSFQSKYDATLGPSRSQQDVFDVTRGCVDSVAEGYNSSIFAYGPTGTGKTHTMLGSRVEADGKGGIIPRALESLFSRLDQMELDAPGSTTAAISFIEIYNEKIHDLLQPFKLEAKQAFKGMVPRKADLQLRSAKNGAVLIPGLQIIKVQDVKSAMELVMRGSQHRAVRHTEMNHQSSRSHSILQISLERKLPGQVVGTAPGLLKSKLNFIDLAGSERWSDHGDMTHARISEMTSINQSLSNLVTVVARLTEGKPTHIPYRDSKLTHILQDSLGGNCLTIFIATVSPAVEAYEETVSTLKFADRARNRRRSGQPGYATSQATHQESETSSRPRHSSSQSHGISSAQEAESSSSNSDSDSAASSESDATATTVGHRQHHSDVKALRRELLEVKQALDAERSARKRLEAEIALERAESGSLSSAHSGVPTDTESDADVETSTRGRQSRLRRSSRSQRPSGSPLADYVLQGFPHGEKQQRSGALQGQSLLQSSNASPSWGRSSLRSDRLSHPAAVQGESLLRLGPQTSHSPKQLGHLAPVSDLRQPSYTHPQSLAREQSLSSGQSPRQESLTAQNHSAILLQSSSQSSRYPHQHASTAPSAASQPTTSKTSKTHLRSQPGAEYLAPLVLPPVNHRGLASPPQLRPGLGISSIVSPNQHRGKELLCNFAAPTTAPQYPERVSLASRSFDALCVNAGHP